TKRRGWMGFSGAFLWTLLFPGGVVVDGGILMRAMPGVSNKVVGGIVTKCGILMRYGLIPNFYLQRQTTGHIFGS
ncbi:MAG: hypothetical protein D9N11_07310, partial [Ketobacter sp.]